MFKKINNNEPIKVILKIRDYDTTIKEEIEETNTPQEAINIMNEWIETHSTIISHYQRYYKIDKYLVCDYGAHNANILFTNMIVDNNE